MPITHPGQHVLPADGNALGVADVESVCHSKRFTEPKRPSVPRYVGVPCLCIGAQSRQSSNLTSTIRRVVKYRYSHHAAIGLKGLSRAP